MSDEGTYHERIFNEGYEAGVRNTQTRLAEAERLLVVARKDVILHRPHAKIVGEIEQFLRAAVSAPAVELWKPHPIAGRWAYWQCATPNGPYNFQASSLDEAEAVCARERTAYSASAFVSCHDCRDPAWCSKDVCAKSDIQDDTNRPGACGQG